MTVKYVQGPRAMPSQHPPASAVQFQPSPVVAEAYHRPSDEALRLVRRARWLTSPERGDSRPTARFAQWVVIAPMTQFTFFNFDLQAFLFLVFHRSPVARVGHAVFMTTEALFLLSWLREVTVLRAASGSLDGALLLTLVLLVWYAGVAWRARLRGWFALTAPLVASLYLASGPLDLAFRERLHISPLFGVLASAMLVALSHSAEPWLPPRTVDRWRWTALADYLPSPQTTLAVRFGRWAHLALIFVTGAMAESWAALRLLPYNWLMLMMRVGYAPQRHAELRSWAERAWATGQPALDFVGTGGGTFLAVPEER